MDRVHDVQRWTSVAHHPSSPRQYVTGIGLTVVIVHVDRSDLFADLAKLPDTRCETEDAIDAERFEGRDGLVFLKVQEDLAGLRGNAEFTHVFALSLIQ